jgi:hypothetical protein
MSTFVVKSVHGSSRLELSGPVRHGSDEHDDSTFIATLRGDNLNAMVHVVDVGPAKWADLFGAMAVEWRGWDGAKEGASLEGHLALSCTADYLGHVRMRVTLRGDIARSDWTAEQTLTIEAGQLETLAEEARNFFARPGV